jgi:hypothetical protein
MSAEAAALSVTFPVGRKYRCTVTIPPPRQGELRPVAFEWEPDVPRRLTKKELRDYRRGRDAAFATLAEQTGLRTLLVEI